ncbi:MAG: tripartite tricarboxylate transporter TctB family protein [Roseinatronobacter sp.]
MTGAIRANLLFGVISIGASIWLLLQAQDLAANPRLFPVAALSAMLLAGLVIVGLALWQMWRTAPAHRDAPPATGALTLAGVSAILVMAGVAVHWLGFYLTSLILILAVHTVHVSVSGARRPTGRDIAQGTSLAVVATAVMYLIFAVLIGLPSPAGALF